jgi:hypothetical protein
MRSADGALALAAIPGPLDRLLQLTGLNQILPTYATSQDAVAISAAANRTATDSGLS